MNLGAPWHPAAAQMVAKITQMGPKSMLNSSKIGVAFLDRFWGGQKVAANTVCRTMLGAIFDQNLKKSGKRHQKGHAKIDVEKVSKNDAKSDRK